MTIETKGPFSCQAFLVFTTQPTDALPNTAISPAVVVTVRDIHGATITGYTSNVTVEIGSGTGTLSGTLTVAAIAGVATFSNLKINESGPKSLVVSSTDSVTGTVLDEVESTAFTIATLITVTFTLTAVEIGGPGNYGMSPTFGGSISPTTFRGKTINVLTTSGIGGSCEFLLLDSPLTQDFIFSITMNTNTNLSSEADDFSSGAGQSDWGWDNHNNLTLPSAGNYAVTIKYAP